MTFHKPGQVPEEFLKDIIASAAAELLAGGPGSGRPAGYRWTQKDYESRVKHKLKFAPAPAFGVMLEETDNPLFENGKQWVVFDKWSNFQQPLKWSKFEGESGSEHVGFFKEQEAKDFAKNLADALSNKPADKRFVLFNDENGSPIIFDVLNMEVVYTDEDTDVFKQHKWLENDFHDYLKALANTTDPAELKHAVDQYKDGMYHYWNGYLREGLMGTGQNKGYEKSIKYLDEAFKYKGIPVGASTLTSDNDVPGDPDKVLLWRGISGGVSQTIKWFENNGYKYDGVSKTFRDKNGKDVVGNTIIDEGFGSCAYQESFAKTWGGQNYVHITMPKDVKVINFHTSEYERVLPRGGVFLIKKIKVIPDHMDSTKAYKIQVWADMQYTPAEVTKKKKAS